MFRFPQYCGTSATKHRDKTLLPVRIQVFRFIIYTVLGIHKRVGVIAVERNTGKIFSIQVQKIHKGFAYRITVVDRKYQVFIGKYGIEIGEVVHSIILFPFYASC